MADAEAAESESRVRERMDTAVSLCGFCVSCISHVMNGIYVYEGQYPL